MMTCPHCQTQIEPEDKFCGGCGYDLRLVQESSFKTTEPALDVTEVKYRLGVVYFKKQNFSAAVELWEQVLTQNPRHRGAHNMLRLVKANQKAEAPKDE